MNKLRIFGGVALLALAPASAFAHADVHFNLDLGYPVYVEPPPVYYVPHRRYRYLGPPVYYGPRVIYEDSDPDYYAHHDWDRHRGHHDDEDDDD